ncbi:MAG: prenyltransferase [Chloroflexota bacterium]
MTTLAQRFSAWRYVMNHANMPEGVEMDWFGKWLVVTRAAVFTMTATSGLIGGLLAIGTAGASVNYWYLALSIIGLVIAHAANNMINDYFDLEGGVDTDEYVRALYAPHPILSGWLSKAQLRNAILLMQAFDLAILLLLVWARGPWVAAFAFGGLFISVFYVAPPIKLKHHGLGEPGVFIVWGPLMIRGDLLRGNRDASRLGLDRLASVRHPGHDGALRKAHRQDVRRYGQGDPHAARHPG